MSVMYPYDSCAVTRVVVLEGKELDHTMTGNGRRNSIRASNEVMYYMSDLKLRS